MKKYRDKIDALVPFAEAEAQKRVREFGKKTEERIGKDGKLLKWCFFTQFFHEEMNRMCRKKEIR